MFIERHRSVHVGWLRALVLGANDGIVSTSSLILGIAAANTTHEHVLLTGLAGLVAGAMAMASGEYVSVSSQSDTENADLERERNELEENYAQELEELAKIYEKRGLDQELAKRVAKELMEHNALEAHARDELGITTIFSARPIQAALTSAAAFSIGAALLLSMVYFFDSKHLMIIVSVSSLLFLMFLGVLAAVVGGAKPFKAALRLGFWGIFAMGITAVVGSIFGVLL
jgi:VIT1/CCC1 family predicted Fe2+/Mn2+ transporter